MKSLASLTNGKVSSAQKLLARMVILATQLNKITNYVLLLQCHVSSDNSPSNSNNGSQYRTEVSRNYSTFVYHLLGTPPSVKFAEHIEKSP